VGVSVAGSNLTKTAATAFGNAGAVSAQTLEFGGYVEFSTTATTTRQMIGLGNGDADQNYPDIEYAMDLSSGTVGIYEAGAYRGAFGTYPISDRFRVEVAFGRARYLNNGVVSPLWGRRPRCRGARRVAVRRTGRAACYAGRCSVTRTRVEGAAAEQARR
jgi:hypothetical protein